MRTRAPIRRLVLSSISVQVSSCYGYMLSTAVKSFGTIADHFKVGPDLRPSQTQLRSNLQSANSGKIFQVVAKLPVYVAPATAMRQQMSYLFN